MKAIHFVHDRQENPASRRQILEMAGYNVLSFTNGADSMQAMEEAVPALVLMDILIEGPNGFEVTKQMRKLYSAAELPILLTSKIYRGRQFREEARQSGAQGYLLRPLDLDDLVRDVGTLVGEYAEPQPGHHEAA